MDALLRFALDPVRPRVATDELGIWWDATAPQRASWTEPFDRAFSGGASADRLGFAFVAGYVEALRALVPELPPGSLSSLCATEETGNHPRAIRTQLTQIAPGRYELSGRKTWASVASPASSLLVVATIGESAGRPQLRVVRVRGDATGVRLTSSSAPFVPEIPHASVELDRVAVSDGDLLPGDGYDRYVKPFRTIEDIHIHAALTGYLIGVARRLALPRDPIERLLSHALAIHSLAHADPSAATTHAALAGTLELGHRLISELEPLWSAAPSDEWTRWQRDRRLLQVAGTARAARRDRAWSLLDSAAASDS